MKTKSLRTAPSWTDSAAPFVAPRRRSDVVEEELDEDAILTDPKTGAIFHMNPTAIDVWRLCDGRTTAHEIALEQQERFDVDFDTALDHVEQLIVAFARSRLFNLAGEL